MKIYAYDVVYTDKCTIDIPNDLKEIYLAAFSTSSPSRKQVENWLTRKGYDMSEVLGTKHFNTKKIS